MKKNPLQSAAFILLLLGGAFWAAGLVLILLAPTTYRATATVSYGEPNTGNESRALNRQLDEILTVPEGIEVAHLRMANVYAVSARAGERNEAARMANASAQTIIERAHEENFSSVRILDEAQPPNRPVSPNVPIVLAAFGGSGTFLILLGSIFLVVHAAAKRNGTG